MDGILIVNKPKNCTSHDIVYKIKKITSEKVGHTGTLDPMATGILPLLIGKGTQCSKYLINHDKIYQAQLKLGIKTDTADSEGKIIEKKDILPNILEKENIQKVLNSFLGEQMQIPPMYSAIKVKGKKLYEYARNGKNVKVEPRKIKIYEIKLIKIYKQEKIIEFEVSCSKGTYIRSLCEDIANRLGTIGYMKNLNRMQVGNFNNLNAVNIENLDNKEKSIELIKKYLIPIEEIFKDRQSIELNNKKLNLFLNGVKLTQDRENGIYKIYSENKFIGTGIIKDGLLKRDIVI